MSIDFPLVLIVAVFVSQVLVLSFICPERMYRAWLAVREKYPPQEFMRLYPIPPERIAQQTTALRIMHRVIGVAAAMALIIALFTARSTYQLALVMLGVCAVQLLPPLLRLPLQLKMARAFRSMPAPSVRSAELRTLRVTDFLSPVWIALGLGLTALSLACAVYFHLLNPSRGFALNAMGFAINAWLLGRMLYMLLGPRTMARPDPYMSADDLSRARQMRMRMPFIAGIFLGAYFIFMELYAAQLLQFDYLHVVAGVSLLCQLLFLRVTHVTLRNLAMRDLAPYRAAAEGTQE